MTILIKATEEQAAAINDKCRVADVVVTPDGHLMTIIIESEMDFWKVFYSGVRYACQ